jgi:hypothetical protein
MAVEYENDELEQDCEEGLELASLLGDNGDISQGDVPQKRESPPRTTTAQERERLAVDRLFSVC